MIFNLLKRSILLPYEKFDLEENFFFAIDSVELIRKKDYQFLLMDSINKNW